MRNSDSKRRQESDSAFRSIIATAATALVMLGGSPAGAETSLLDYEIEGTLTAPIVEEDEAAFEQRHGTKRHPTGGIRNLYAEWLVGDGDSLKLEGRSIFDNHDYLLRVRYDKSETGRVDAGYREFRTWYDGHGGYFPLGNAFFTAFSPDMAVDRGEAWIDSTLALPDLPEVRLRYRHWFREGRKPSTVWGPTTQTGGNGARAIVNAANRLDETTDSFAVDVAHRIGETRIGAGFRYDTPDIDNARDASFQPGEPDAERFTTTRDKVNGDNYGAHGFTEHRFLDDRLLVSSSYAYTHGENDIGGSRVFGPSYGSAYDPAFANRQPFDAGFLDLNGATDLERHKGRVDVAGVPHADLRLQLGLRVENMKSQADSSYTDTSVGTFPVRPTFETPFRAKGQSDDTAFGQSLELRYSGIDSLVLYVTGDWEEGNADVEERQHDAVTDALLLDRKTDIDRFAQEYAVGANWYATRLIQLAAKYTYGHVDGDYDNRTDSTPNTGPNRYPAYLRSLDTESQHAFARISWRPLNRLRSGVRYDFRILDYDAEYALLDDLRSGRTVTHAVGAETTWTPIDAVYVHANATYVDSETKTSAADLTGPATGLSPNFDNDYFTSTLASGWSVTENLDLEGRYFFYSADNDENNAAESQPYGAKLQEHGVSLGLAYRARENLTWKAGYGYFESDDDLSGGFNDYRANLVTVGVEATY
jgi:hypothetical protein